ncbi:hypothetical protein ABIB62_002527 [Mucilaginibacter sp. UYP25]
MCYYPGGINNNSMQLGAAFVTLNLKERQLNNTLSIE